MKQANLLIIGTGYVGSAAANFFLKKGWHIAATCRSKKAARALQSEGVTPYICDVLKRNDLKKLPSAQFLLIAIAPTKHEVSDYREIYLNGLANILDRFRHSKQLKRIVYLSSTRVYGNCEGRWVDERTTPNPNSEKSNILFQAEQKALNSGLDVVIFRLGGIYGPGRNRIKPIQANLKLKYETTGYLNLIHLADVVRGISILFSKASPRNVYLGVDGRPVMQSQINDWLYRKIFKKDTTWKARKRVTRSGKRCRSSKLKSLGFSFQFSSFKSGYSALLKNELK